MLDGIVELLETTPQNHRLPFSAVVYKIDRNRSGIKQVYFRIFQGSIKLRDTITLENTSSASSRLKIKNLKGISNGRIENVEQLMAGDIGIFHGENDPENRRCYWNKM